MNSTSLGSLLATRLDAVLGTTLAQHPVLLDGTRSNAAQPASALHGQETTIRRATGEVGEAAARTGQAGTRVGTQAGADGGTAPGQGQASARTLLSEPARTILALLLSGMSGKAVVQGRLPLLLLPDLLAAGRLPPASNTGANTSQTGTPATGQGGTPGTPGTPGATTANPAAGGSGTPGPAAPGAPSGAGNTGAAPAQGSPGRPTAGAASTSAGAGATTAASATLPPGPANLVATLANALQRTVSQSGLFYESHLSQMAFGQRSAAEVAREPQARLLQTSSGNSGGSAGPTQTGTTGPSGQPSVAAAPATTMGAAQAGVSQAAGAVAAGHPASSVMAAQAAAGAAMAPAVSAGLPLAGIHPDAAPLVRQQLEVLANQMFAWQGEAWNGTPMQWEIRRRQGEEGSSDTLATWATRLQLQLPKLGTVEARLSLAGDQLVLRLGAPDSAPLLQTHLDLLRERLQQQGLQLTDTTVSHDPGPRAATA